MNSNAKIGLFGTGLDTYWGQFDGLLDELKGYQARIRDRMERDAGVQVADAGMVDRPCPRARSGFALRPRAGRSGVPLYGHLLSVVDDPARRAAAQLSGGGAQPATDAGHRLRAAQRPGRPRPDDGHVAGELPGLLGARNRQRAGAQPPAVRLRDGMARRSGRLAADRRVDRRCGRLCRYASEPARRTGTLLRGDARRIYRPHAPVGRLRDARRTARNVRAACPARGGDRRGGRGQDRGVPRGFRGVARMRAGGAGACGAHVGGPRPLGGGARAGGDGLLLRGCSGQRLRADRHLRDRRQYAAHRDGESPWRASAR